MKTWDHYDYRIAEHYLSALINGDTSGLDDDDAATFAEWESDAQQNAREAGFTVGHWCDIEDSGDDWGRCDVSGLMAMRVTVRLHVYKVTTP